MAGIENPRSIIETAQAYAHRMTEQSPLDFKSIEFAVRLEDYLMLATNGLCFWFEELVNMPNPDKESLAEKSQVRNNLRTVLRALRSHMPSDKILAQYLYTSGTLATPEQLAPLISEEEDVDKYFFVNEDDPINFKMIGVVGMIRSGKGTVGNIIAEHWHSQHLPLSNRLREIAAAKGLDETFPRSELRKIDRQFKPRFGQDVFERWTMNLMRRLVKLHGYIGMSTDGYRGFRAAQNSKRLGGVLIAVLASQEIRYQRLLADGRLGDDYSFEKFLESDRIEREWIEPIFEICDYTIVNEGSDKELRDNTASVLAGVERK